MRAPRTRRPTWLAHRLRVLVKCTVLFLRLLRTRPTRQKIALAFLVAVPLILVLRSALWRAGGLSGISLGLGRYHGRGYQNGPSATQPEGGAEGAPALGSDQLRVYPDNGVDPLVNALRLQPPPPSDGVRIAYFIQVGADSVTLVPRLLRAMHHPTNVYVVHVDAKVSQRARTEVSTAIARNAALSANVHFLPPEMVTYKGVSMALNTLSAMAYALRVSPGWHYFINLSGSDYPLLPPKAQQQLLARPGVQLGRLNFMTLFPRSQWRPYAFRVRYMHWDPAVSGAQQSNARLRVFKGLREDPLEKYRHYTFGKAEAWMILSRPFVRFLTRSGFAKRMLLAHLHTRSAPEHYFANVLINHPAWRRTLVPDALRKVVWYHRGRRSGQHPFILDKSSSDPFSFWQDLKATRSLFARKFIHQHSPLIRRIDWRLSGFFDKNQDDIDEDDELSEEDARAFRLGFYRNLASHFDELTQQTLSNQGVQWPTTAYPPINSLT